MKQAANTPISPVEEPLISDVFGSRVNPVTGRAEFHKGIDLALAPDTPVKACIDGIAEDCGYSDSYGYYLRIRGERYSCLYAHLNKVCVRKGAQIKQGETAALSGDTGQSTGPHLHFELYQGERNTDPYFIFKE
ncbi:MAG: M23 family metallopeptidase [Firmicutes bacterium]|nr:M23 family metallopeptidase [Bacillota bacterium]